MTTNGGSGDAPGGRTRQVMDAVRSRIASRVLGAGDRLPSIRAMAISLAVSPSTVVQAYDRLAAEGLIRPRRGAGFYVTRAGLGPIPLSVQGPRLERDVDPLWVSRQSLDADPAALKPGCGWLPADWMPAGEIRRALRSLARADDAPLTDYGGTRGPQALRRVLLARFFEEGLDIGPDQLLLTASGTQAIDLLCRFLLREGDTVVVDDPCYFNFRALLRAHRVRLVSVPHTATGPDMPAFESLLATERPRLYLTNSALHNPTGATMSPQTAHRLLNAASRHDLTIIEDDIFADFEPEPSTRLATLDGLQRVIRVGSFSKTLSASLRCGYVAARADWVEGLLDLQVATGFGGPSPLAAELIASVLTGGTYRKHLEEVRSRLARCQREVAARLRRLGIEPWLMPRGGLYLWSRLPDARDAAAVARAALERNVVLAPGNVFSVAQSADAFLRFNVAQSTSPRIWEVLRRALEQAA